MAHKKKTVKPKTSLVQKLFGTAKRTIITVIVMSLFGGLVGYASYQYNETDQAIRDNFRGGIVQQVIHPFKNIHGGFQNYFGNKKSADAKFFRRNVHAEKAMFWGGNRKYQRNNAASGLSKKDQKKYWKLYGNSSPKEVKKAEKFLDSKNKEYAKKTKKEDTKQNARDASNVESNSGSNGDSSFKSKIAQALLHLFWSSGIGKWITANGATGTVFAYSPWEENGGVMSDSSAIDDPDVAGQLADRINSYPSELMFPTSSYSSKFAPAIDALQGPLMGFAAVLLVMAVIVGATKMGWGQAFDSVRSRQEWYYNIVDIMISVTGIFSLPLFVSMLLQIDGALLQLFAQYMQSVTLPGGDSLMTIALRLGADKATLKALTKGTILGPGFAGIIFSIIYIMTMIGLAVWVKYYYFCRMVAFIILMVVGPIFIAMWPFGWGKARTMNWIRDVIGTIFIQPIQAFTLTLMATLMAINSDAIGTLGAGGSGESKKEKAKAMVDAANAANTNSGLSDVVNRMNGLSSNWAIASHFETMIMGFIILILFQPVSKGIAELFGIGTSMLDRIHSSTSRTLTTGAAIAGLAGVGMAAGGVALAKGGLNGAGALAGKTAKKAAEQLGNPKTRGKAKLADKLNKFAKKQQGAGKKARENLAKANALLGPNAAKIAGAALGAGAGGNPAVMTALSVAGGEIGKRAAELTSIPLTTLGMKREDSTRELENARVDAEQQGDRSINKAAEAKNDAVKGPIDEKLRNASDKEKAAANQVVNNNLKAAGNLANDSTANADRVAAQAKQMKDGNYVNNEDVQSAVNESTSQAVKNGSTWNKEHLGSAMTQPTTMAEVKAKAKDINFDHDGFVKDYQKTHSDPVGSAQFIDAENGAMQNYADNVMAAGQISAGVAGAATTDPLGGPDGNQINQQMSQWTDKQMADYHGDPNDAEQVQRFLKARQVDPQYGYEDAHRRAYANADNSVLFHKDQSANPDFMQSKINLNTFQSNLGDRLSSLYVPADTVDDILGSTQDIDGERLMSTVDISNGQSTKVLNGALYNNLTGQNAFTLSSQGVKVNGNPITASDLGKIYQPNYTQKFDAFNQQQMDKARINEITDQALNTGSSNFLSRGLLGGGAPRMRGTATYQEAAAAAMQNNPYTAFTGANSLSLQEAQQILPTRRNSQGEPIGVDPGSLRMAVTNTHSFIEARDSNGVYHQVGNWGVGDGNLGAAQTAYQDLDLSPSGELSVRNDPVTHQPTSAYRLGDSGRIPVSLASGIPAFSQFFSAGTNMASASTKSMSAKRAAPYTYSGFNSMKNAPELRDARQQNRLVYGDQYHSRGYTDIVLRGNYNGVVMTGVDPTDGETKVLSQVSRNTVWPGMSPGYEFEQKLRWSQGQYVIDSKSEPRLIHGAGFTADQSRMTLLQNTMRDNILGHRKLINQYINESIMLPTRPVERNHRANHGAHTSLSGTDTFTK